MSLLTVTALAKSFGPVDIFSDVSLSIPRRARIGLVGPNGVGKTTLLRILLGEEEPTSGAVHRARNLRIGYLPQEAQLHSERTLWQECLTVFSDLIRQQSELARLEAAMADPGQAETAIHAYGRLQETFELAGGYTYETRIRQTLTGLGFSPADLNRPLEHLSGGQRTRALLAKLLLSDPDLLLLDEPTNHLDIAAVEWLENYLKDWQGATLIVSHDRYFLDQVVNVIWEMTPALEIYHGNYSVYLMQREERYQRRLEEYRAQQEFIEKETEYIRRNIAGQNTRQAQGRLRRLEHMLEEVRLAPPKQPRKLRFRLQAGSRSGDLVLRTIGLVVGYHDEGKPLFHAPDLVLKRGECAAIIGPNGAGKTTFLKTLLEQVPPYSGEVCLGTGLKIGYFAQAHEGLRGENTILEEINRVVPTMLPQEARDYLARFLFTGDDVFKEVRLLSGGERGRLALACLALKGANLLLLDEPTNHLDLPSQEILQSLLADFQGTILLVSHDRYLIDALATQIWEVETTRKALRVFDGTYSEYRAARQVEAQRKTAEKTTGQAGRQTKGKRQPSLTPAERRHRERIRLLEEEITTLEDQVTALARQLENPPADSAKVMRLGSDYQNLQRTLEARINEWAELTGE